MKSISMVREDIKHTRNNLNNADSATHHATQDTMVPNSPVITPDPAVMQNIEQDTEQNTDWFENILDSDHSDGNNAMAPVQTQATDLVALLQQQVAQQQEQIIRQEQDIAELRGVLQDQEQKINHLSQALDALQTRNNVPPPVSQQPFLAEEAITRAYQALGQALVAMNQRNNGNNSASDPLFSPLTASPAAVSQQSLSQRPSLFSSSPGAAYVTNSNNNQHSISPGNASSQTQILLGKRSYSGRGAMSTLWANEQQSQPYSL